MAFIYLSPGLEQQFLYIWYLIIIYKKKMKRATLYNELETHIQCKSQMKPNLLHTWITRVIKKGISSHLHLLWCPDIVYPTVICTQVQTVGVRLSFLYQENLNPQRFIEARSGSLLFDTACSEVSSTLDFSTGLMPLFSLSFPCGFLCCGFKRKNKVTIM